MLGLKAEDVKEQSNYFSLKVCYKCRLEVRYYTYT